uniref:Olfactory receptor n=1 Tax=Chelydra serpentina TaxID=8475 RepID=A0A8C3TFZ8_CHESE
MDLIASRETENHTRVQEFILLVFPGTWYFQMSLAELFSVIYVLTILGNVPIIALMGTHPRLHTPMYFFLCNLSFLEIWYTTACVPKAIGVMLETSQTISFTACKMQLIFSLATGSTECFLLAVMAYDRYLAICHPLHYSSLMNRTFSAQLVLLSWLCGFLAISVLAAIISRLSFCGPNIINHFLCDIDSWIALSCTDTHLVELVTFILSIIVVVVSCVITFVSYVYIISTILRIPSAQGRQKAFSTCSAHLTVVTIWYSSLTFLYVNSASGLDLVVAVLYSVVPPVMNPVIYSMRNKELKVALRKLTGWRLFTENKRSVFLM